MKRRIVILLVVFCIGAVLFFLRNGTDPVVKKNPPGQPVAVPRAAPFGTKLVPEKGVTPTPSPRADVTAGGSEVPRSR